MDMRTVAIPGTAGLKLEHLVLDLNGTLTDRGALIAGVAIRLKRLAGVVQLHLVTADTFGTAHQLGVRLGIDITTVANGDEKAAFVTELGADVTVAIGNGRNDEAMLRTARLGIAVIGPEGAAVSTVLAADVVCRGVTDALDLIAHERLLAATLRP
jgi:soluble P-type ATPase